MVGSAILRKLKQSKFKKVKYASRKELDFLNQVMVKKYFKKNSFDLLIIAAAKVGGIIANTTYPADFIYENLQIQLNLINSANEVGIKKIIFLGSSCIYPRMSSQPIKESELLNGYLEKTNEPYAIAKIAGIKICESYNRQFNRDYRSLMPTNLYGPNDNFDNKTSHVVPGLIKKFHNGKINNKKSVEVWGTGKSQRELMHVDDLADACLEIIKISKKSFNEIVLPMQSHINVGSDIEISIRDLAYKIKEIVGYKGKITFNHNYPDGTPRKKLNSKILKSTGWKAKIDLSTGLKQTYEWYIQNINSKNK